MHESLGSNAVLQGVLSVPGKGPGGIRMRSYDQLGVNPFVKTVRSYSSRLR